MQGTLYVCGTPIGNLEDITLRQLRILKEVDIIVAEDTRHTLKLLNFYNIKNKLISYHEHNKNYKGNEILKMLQDGKNIALVTDAGMPGISDPGEDLIKLCRDNNIVVTSAPGPTAVITALVLSGLKCNKYIFEGFLSDDKKEKNKVLDRISHETRTVVLYEAPHNIIKTLKLLEDTIGGDRIISIVRELTKKYEEIITKSISQMIEYFSSVEPKGEFVIVISGEDEEIQKKEEINKWLDMSVEDHMKIYLENGLQVKEAIKLVSRDRNVPKREIYNIVMKK